MCVGGASVWGGGGGVWEGGTWGNVCVGSESVLCGEGGHGGVCV